jgi:hypothetical protein
MSQAKGSILAVSVATAALGTASAVLAQCPPPSHSLTAQGFVVSCPLQGDPAPFPPGVHVNVYHQPGPDPGAIVPVGTATTNEFGAWSLSFCVGACGGTLVAQIQGLSGCPRGCCTSAQVLVPSNCGAVWFPELRIACGARREPPCPQPIP